jgi:hypothetical protein
MHGNPTITHPTVQPASRVSSPDPAVVAAELRRQADHLNRLADQLDGGNGKPKTSSPSSRPLSDAATAAAVFIRSNPGCCGDVIARAIGCSHDHFRADVMRVLRRRGYFNIKGGHGYFAPDGPETPHKDPTTFPQTPAARAG